MRPVFQSAKRYIPFWQLHPGGSHHAAFRQCCFRDYRHHRASGQAVVSLGGQDFYLGPYGTKASKIAYDRLIGKWLAGGRQLASSNAAGDLTITELIARYWEFAKQHYRKDGLPTQEVSNIRYAIRPLRQLYATTPAREFGPLALKAIQQRFIRDGICRNQINHRVGKIKRLFMWAVSEQLVPASVFQALQTVVGTPSGSDRVWESPPCCRFPMKSLMLPSRIFPPLWPIWCDSIDSRAVDQAKSVRSVPATSTPATMSGFTSRPVTKRSIMAANGGSSSARKRRMCYVRTSCGRSKVIASCRPSRKSDGATKSMKPAKRRCITATVQEVTGNESLVARPETATTRMPTTGRFDVAWKKRTPLVWTAAVKNGINPEDVQLITRWHANQLRHSVATSLCAKFGLEAARTVLGHADPKITLVYAEADFSKAAEVMKAVG